MTRVSNAGSDGKAETKRKFCFYRCFSFSYHSVGNTVHYTTVLCCQVAWVDEVRNGLVYMSEQLPAT